MEGWHRDVIDDWLDEECFGGGGHEGDDVVGDGITGEVDVVVVKEGSADDGVDA